MRTTSDEASRRQEWRTYADRREAGRALADRLAGEAPADAVVVGLARGGVVVAAEVARRLRLPLDAVAVRKVGHPLQPEYGIGAATPDGRAFVGNHAGLSDAEVDAVVAATRAAAEALDRRLHARTAPVALAGRTCLLVDDGVATGGTMVAAARWARGRGASRVVIAVPVGPAASIEPLAREADAVLCLESPPQLHAVGAWYDDFRQVSDTEVVSLLANGPGSPERRSVTIAAGQVVLPGDLTMPDPAAGVILFAHGSGSSRHSPRNQSVAHRLNQAGLATLMFDLLSPAEALDRRQVFDIPLLARRLRAATAWAGSEPATRLPTGYFGASTGAAAALLASADEPTVSAIVSRGGRPDLTGSRLPDVRAATLLIVGGADTQVLALNRHAMRQLRCDTELVVIPQATHLFEEPGALDEVAERAAEWFLRHLE